MSKLKIQELEARIAPSVGLVWFLDTNFPGSVDGEGNLDLGYFEGMAKEAGHDISASPVGDSVNISNAVIPDSLQQAIEEALG